MPSPAALRGSYLLIRTCSSTLRPLLFVAAASPLSVYPPMYARYFMSSLLRVGGLHALSAKFSNCKAANTVPLHISEPGHMHVITWFQSCQHPTLQTPESMVPSLSGHMRIQRSPCACHCPHAHQDGLPLVLLAHLSVGRISDGVHMG